MSRPNLLERQVERVLRRPPSIRSAASVIVLVTVLVVLSAGILIRVIDRSEYPTIGRGIWYSLQTVTTVGYGDVTPAHLTGRLVGAFLMLEGTAFIAVITAVITSTFVARASRDYQAAQAKDDLTDRELIEKRFDELERKIDALGG
jgi:voltage-gated potassium channel